MPYKKTGFTPALHSAAAAFIPAAAQTPRTKSRAPSVGFYTLGCKLNQSETDSMAAQLAQRGFEVHSLNDIRSKRFDYTVINTCTVTAKADRKTRNTIYKALRAAGLTTDLPAGPDASMGQENNASENETRGTSNGIVIVTGCFVGSGRDELEGLPVSYIVDNGKKKHIADIIEAHYRGHILNPDELPEEFFSKASAKSMFKTRDNLKIQDGCDNFCTFCIIPSVRGKARSKDLAEIVQDARVLIECGTKELVLTGVNMSRYAHEGHTFSTVLESLLKLPGDFRIRISSLEPDGLDEGFFRSLSHEKMCPHLHLCLQSGSEKILLQMRRMYTKKSFLQCVEKIRAVNPLFNFTTDVIVGFPGECDEDFAQTLDTVREAGFSHVHVFPYSAREGTRASRMEQDISRAAVKERLELLQAVGLEQKNAYRKKLLGSPQRVLVEKISEDGRVASGLSQYYAPVSLAVSSHETGGLQNKMVAVTPQSYSLSEHGEVILEAHAQ